MMQEGEAFELALEKYVRRFLVKGIPSLFSDLKGLYRYVCPFDVSSCINIFSDPGLQKSLTGYAQLGQLFDTVYIHAGEFCGQNCQPTGIFLLLLAIKCLSQVDLAIFRIRLCAIMH